jgi:hypothetical protein
MSPTVRTPVIGPAADAGFLTGSAGRVPAPGPTRR